MSIQVLSADVVNQIAAGEVVERPAHLVKELIENSLDANATEVHVEIAHGGRFVRILDNGDGILSTDLLKALMPHATSKITLSDDLWNLNTFGFRGEALASISAVSKLTIQSFHHQEKKPSQVTSNFGVATKVRDSSRSIGTEIQIEDLFENVPARLKFLKSDSAESTQIKQIIKSAALSNPHVEIKLIQDGELQLFYKTKKTLIERVRDVLEKKELFESKLTKGSMTAHVVYSSPHEVAKTSKQIWVFAQNRYIQDRALQAAVMDAYRSLLMHGEYPYAVVKLQCAPAEIDVNIHPTKSQVKFQDASNAFRVVHGALRQALETAPWIQKHLWSNLQNSNPSFGAGTSSASGSSSSPSFFNEQTPAQQFADFQSGLDSAKSVHKNLSFHDQTFTQTQFKQKDFDIQSLSELRIETSSVGYWSSLQVLGQANLTYIVCQKNDRLVYVDQHAAHERVVFESLMQSWKMKKFEIQDYLFPMAIDLSEDKIEALLYIQKSIAELGIEIDRLGPQVIGVKSAPSLIKESALPALFEKMANDLLEYGDSYAIEKKVSDLFATMACHSVVRAGQSLSHQQMKELLVSMDQFALSSFCPHGRPVSVETTFVELEKLFGRIN
ncbi:MAG: DNA mismatch repair endonuclease MutL [Bdellovibrio sp.]|nr:DNA mismatch repair endonuclease MutL [Bdellovibrio sp.]